MSSRRKFVRQLALLSGAAFVASKASAGIVASSWADAASTSPHDPLAHASFAALQGARFSVEGAGVSGGQRWTLSDVTRYERGAQVENFSLQFTGDANAPLPQGIYRLSNPQLGKVELFVVASPATSGAVAYAAVINRLV